MAESRGVGHDDDGNDLSSSGKACQTRKSSASRSFVLTTQLVKWHPRFVSTVSGLRQQLTFLTPSPTTDAWRLANPEAQLMT